MDTSPNSDVKKEIEFILKVFKTVKHVQTSRYRKGLSVRQAVLKQRRNGEEPSGYRVDFLIESVFKLFKFLEELGNEFNKEHPQDMFTSADIGDILVNAIAILENKVPD